MISEGQFLIGLLVIFTIGFSFLYRKLDDGKFPWVVSVLFGIFSSVMLSLAVFPGVRSLDSNKTHYYIRKANITSIKNADEVGGHFMLGSGNIEQIEYYYYYYKSVEGYVRGKKPVNGTFIVEDNSDRPHIEIRKTHYESKSGIFKYWDEEDEIYKIVVPKGTVVNRFEVY